MKKKISKEKVFEILKYVCIGLAIIIVVGLVGSLFTRSDGDGVRVPTNSRPSIEETEPAPVIKTFWLSVTGSGTLYHGECPMSLSYEEGMTWAEWVNSSYNTVNVSLNEYGDQVLYEGCYYIFVTDGLNGPSEYNDITYGEAVKSTDLVQYEYYAFED